MGQAEHLGDRVVRMCFELGFALGGVCSAEPSEYAQEFSAWLAQGKHGSMEYLARHAEAKIDPCRVLEGARSVVMVADQYASRQDSPDAPVASTVGSGRVARYARGDDYHDVMKQRLHVLCDRLREEFPDGQFRAFVDTAPVMERELAVRAGLGWMGKNTLVIHPRLGSWLLLGGLLTTLQIPPPPGQEVVLDHCGTCTRCVDACPTSAITPYSVDARRCISYLTIEHRGNIDPALAAEIGDRAFGCDVCQEVCPHNSPREDPDAVGEAHAGYHPRTRSLDLLEVLGWGAQERSRTLGNSAIKRATLAMMKRNAIIALANEADPASRTGLVARLVRMAADANEDPLVRSQARQSLERFGVSQA